MTVLADGALSLVTGLAANLSLETGLPVRADDVLALRRHDDE